MKYNKEVLTEEWKLYQRGLDYNSSIQYKTKADRNERFYAGDQWWGVASANLPTPVFNIIKRIVDSKISHLLTQPLKILYNTTDSKLSQELSSCAAYHWEKDKMDYQLRLALLSGALSGDMCAYSFWESGSGDFSTEILDGVNVHFGNVNDARAQTQPYILVAGRAQTAYLRAQAKERGLAKEEIDKIVSDSEDEDGKCTYIIKFYKREGRVYYSKSVKSVTIVEEQDTGLTLYPIAWGNWIPRKNSYHGESEAASLIPAQIFYNKQMAMAQKSSMDTAYPKVLYDKTRIAGFSNAVGGAFGVNGDVSNVARYLDGGKPDDNALKLLREAANMTYQSAGVTDALTGEMRPENTSAIIALQKAAATPLDMQRAAMLQFAEDIAEIWLDFIKAKYKGGKTLYLNTEEGLKALTISAEAVSDMVVRTRIDIGASTLWSEAMALDTLSALLNSGQITLKQFLERVPKGVIPKVGELIEELGVRNED